jgi:dGTPase
MVYSEPDYKRVREEPAASAAAGRSDFRRDFGRLLHSPAFRRLQGKTQLFPGHETDFFRNRLTHSLEVAQVAKGIALQINETEGAFRDSPIDTNLVELAALAHDLGHPPFGHNGEKALDDCMKGAGGFEGNAQTLRLLSCIEKKVLADPMDELEASDHCGISRTGKDRRIGLNLTYRTLAALLKYDTPIPVKRPKDAELAKGYYASQARLVRAIKRHVGKPPRGAKGFKTVECQIMDIADDIAYSTYDLEDAMKGGFSHPLALLATLGTDRDLVGRIHAKVKKEIKDASEVEVFKSLQALFDLGSDGATEDPTYLALLTFKHSTVVANNGYLRVGFTSNLVDKFMKGIRVNALPGDGVRFSRVYLERETHLQIESLKHLNYELMIMSPRLKVVEYRGYELVRTIFEALDAKDGNLLLPEDYRQMHARLKSSAERKRLICDFIAGMTDRYAVEFYSRLKESGASIFKPI